MIKRFYNRSQVAEYLGISRQYLYRLEKKVRLPDMGRGHLGSIRSDNVDKWVKENWDKSWYAGQVYFHSKI